MELKQVTDRIGESVEGLRDRTADVVAADGDSLFRALAATGRHIDASEAALRERIDAAETTILDRVEVGNVADRRTTWPRRAFWLAVGAAVGAAAAYLADPDRGTARRARLSDQASSRAREITTEVTSQAKRAANEVRGAVIEGARDRVPDLPEEDAALLEQRIKSEVLGRRGDVDKVVLRIDGPGTVAVKGTVPDTTAQTDLLRQIAEVRGVVEVTSELVVSQ